MKIARPALLSCMGAMTSAHAELLAHEPFDYTPPAALTGLSGGTGWLAAWLVDGASVSTTSPGLQYSDAIGNILSTSGFSADTTGPATTRSLRDFESAGINNVWISFLYQLPTSNSKFEGVSFYRGSQQVFTVSNPSTTATAGIFLGSNLSGGATSNTGAGTFGQTHLVVLKLTKATGTGDTDRIEAFIDPILTGIPSSPGATVNGSNFDFDRVRIAAQDGSTLLVDELRVGTTFADVTPHTSAGDIDSDGDGLTDAQEIALGLDPFVSDAALIAGIQANPEWFGLYTTSGILGLGNGGVILPQTADAPVDFTFEIQQSQNLTQWDLHEAFTRQIELPPGKNFLRVTLQDQ